ncbi:hypothetical protein GVX76_11230, partial [[Haemophilus] felis]|nr:hypothetical protein [[Haemophilus] felis]
MLNHKTPFSFLHFSLMFALGLAYFPALAQDKDIYLQGKNIALKAATETQIKEHQSALKSAS